MQRLLVTGGAGFIGGWLVRHLLGCGHTLIINVDKLTYAANLESLEEASRHPNCVFAQLDISDQEAISALLHRYEPDAIIHLAAESHVDRSIDTPAAFIATNIVGTYALLEAARHYWSSLANDRRRGFRFHHVSTDEVFGSLGANDRFTETTAYRPNSPYAASKASSDHLARAWHETFGLPVVVTNCSNNYGPYQFPEKLIPLMIVNALTGQPLPVYGRGANIRDWLYVEDHVRALMLVCREGKLGETYNIGGNCERSNLDVVQQICDIVDELRPWRDGPRRALITLVSDRPGHDHRYAMDTSKIAAELGWSPVETFTTGLQKTVRWYVENERWWRQIRDSRYHGERLGVAMTPTLDPAAL